MITHNLEKRGNEFIELALDTIFSKLDKDFSEGIQYFFDKNPIPRSYRIPVVGFTYKNIEYRTIPSKKIQGLVIPLSFKLHREFDNFIEKHENFIYEKRTIKGYLKKVLNLIKYDQELVEILPENFLKQMGFTILPDCTNGPKRSDILLFLGSHKKEKDILMKNLMLNAILE